MRTQKLFVEERQEADSPSSLVFQTGISWKDVTICASVSPITIIGSKETRDLSFMVKRALLLSERLLTAGRFIFTGQIVVHHSMPLAVFWLSCLPF